MGLFRALFLLLFLRLSLLGGCPTLDLSQDDNRSEKVSTCYHKRSFENPKVARWGARTLYPQLSVPLGAIKDG